MEKQSQLFDDPTVQDPPPNPRQHKREGAFATPWPIGSGPPGETCKSCIHQRDLRYHEKVYHKCNLLREHWTHGGATDIRLKWAACWSWMPFDLRVRVANLGHFAVELLNCSGNTPDPTDLFVIADYYDEAGLDMGWLRHTAGKLQKALQKPGA